MAREKIINLPPAFRLRETEFVWENFESTVFFPFIHDFTSEIKKDFANIQFWIPLLIFDPRKLATICDTRELEAILNHYGQGQSNTFDVNFVQLEPDVNPTRAKAEQDDFRILMLLKHKNYEHHIDFEIKAAKNSTSEKSKKEIDRLPKPRRTFTPQLMWKKLKHR